MAALLFEQGYGYAECRQEDQGPPDDAVGIASISKLFAARR